MTISVSSMQAFKKQKNNSYFHRTHDDEESIHDLLSFVRATVTLPIGPHAPNSQESKKLRQLCSKTSLTPEEVRKIKKYRQELANASKVIVKRHPNWKLAFTIRRIVIKKNKLHPQHPHFFELFEKEWNNHSQVKYSKKEIISPKEAFALTLKT